MKNFDLSASCNTIEKNTTFVGNCVSASDFRIDGTFELKNSPGISYWGYKNLVDFIRFQDNIITILIKISILFDLMF